MVGGGRGLKEVARRTSESRSHGRRNSFSERGWLLPTDAIRVA
jgi:hypothetical protein